MGRSLKASAKARNRLEPQLEANSAPSPATPPTQQQQKSKRHSEPNPSSLLLQARPKRRATNAHIIRFLQTRNPNRLEEEDLKRALEASLEEHPDFWPAEDTASCSSSDQSNAPSASSSSSSTGGGRLDKDSTRAKSSSNIITTSTITTTKRRFKAVPTRRGLKHSSTMQPNHLSSNICNCQHAQQPSISNYQTSHPTSNCSANTHCCPMSSVHNRYKPVTKKNVYKESDFFHDGIMEYIEYELYRRGVVSYNIEPEQ